MGIITYVGAIVSSVRRNKKVNIERIKTTHPIHSCNKEQHLKWVEEGKCQCCGGESGEYKGICDDCRLS
jgi:hypothetical protein